MNLEREYEVNPVFLDKSGNAVVQKEIAAQRESYAHMRLIRALRAMQGNPAASKPPERRIGDRRQNTQGDRRQTDRRMAIKTGETS